MVCKMTSYSTSKYPMSINQFRRIAATKGWFPDHDAPREQPDDLVLTNGRGDFISAYVQPTMFADHVGFAGGSQGVVEEWDELTPEQRFLEGIDDVDPEEGEYGTPEDNVLAYYAEDPSNEPTEDLETIP